MLCWVDLIWVFPKIGISQNGWFIMENAIKMHDSGYHYFWKHPYDLISGQITIIPKPEFFGDFGGMGPLLNHHLG